MCVGENRRSRGVGASGRAHGFAAGVEREAVPLRPFTSGGRRGPRCFTLDRSHGRAGDVAHEQLMGTPQYLQLPLTHVLP